VDASTRDGLKKIDRPLFRDFWDRFIASLQALSNKVGNLMTFELVSFDMTPHFSIVDITACTVVQAVV